MPGRIQLKIYLNGFTPNSDLTGRIRPGINYWSNWVEIH